MAANAFVHMTLRKAVAKAKPYSAEVRQALSVAYGAAVYFHKNVTQKALVMSPAERIQWLATPDVKRAEEYTRGKLGGLKNHGINLLQFSVADVCESLVEIYPTLFQ